MSSRIIGVEFGHDTLKLAAVSGGTVTAMAVERLPDGLVRDGRVTAPDAMYLFIKEACAAHGIRRGPCALVLPKEVLITRRITMPLMGVDELKLNLPFEFRDFVGKESGKYTYDYAMVSHTDSTMEIFAAAVLTEALDEYEDILRRAGLKLRAAMPPEMAWLNLIRSCDTEPEQLCIVDVGAAGTHVNIYRANAFEMGKDIPIGGLDLDRAIAAAESVDPFVARTHKEADLNGVQSLPQCVDIYGELSIEIMRVLNFYASSTPEGAKLQDLYFCGGGCDIEGLRTAIIKRTDFTPHSIRRLLNDREDSAAAGSCAMAVGAAMQLQ